MAYYKKKGSGERKVDNLSNKIKNLRKQKKQTQQNIADLLGVRRSTYGEYERGKILPPMDKLKVLADHFNVTVDYLIGNEEQTTEEIDVSDNLESALEYLKNDNDLYFKGQPLDDESRELLISSIENGLKMAYLISKQRGK